MNPSVHIDRARIMVAAGKSAEAKFYLRHLGRGCIRHARLLGEMARSSENRSTLLDAAANREEGIAFALASRAIRGGAVRLAFAEFPYSSKVPNPHWQELTDAGCFHGVFVMFHRYHDKRGGYLVEVQVHPPDEERSQCCANKRFDALEDAETYGRKWITVGEAVVAATVGTVEMRPGKAEWDAAFGEATKKTKRLRPGRAA